MTVSMKLTKIHLIFLMINLHLSWVLRVKLSRIIYKNNLHDYTCITLVESDDFAIAMVDYIADSFCL